MSARLALETGFALAVHPGDRPGRVAFVDCTRLPGVGFVENTPWPIQGQSATEAMTRAAREWAENDPSMPACDRLRSLLTALDRALLPLVAANASSDDDSEWRWDFGGHAGFVALDGVGLRVARVGTVRVVAVLGGVVTTLLEEHSLAAQFRAAGVSLEHTDLNHIVVECLSGRGAPADAVSECLIERSAVVVLGSSQILLTVPDAVFRRVATFDVQLAAQELLDTGLRAGQTAGAVIVARAFAP